VIQALIHASHDLDPNVPVFKPTTMETQLNETIGSIAWWRY